MKRTDGPFYMFVGLVLLMAFIDNFVDIPKNLEIGLFIGCGLATALFYVVLTVYRSKKHQRAIKENRYYKVVYEKYLQAQKNCKLAEKEWQKMKEKM